MFQEGRSAMASQANPNDANHCLANNGFLGASTLGIREAAWGTQHQEKKLRLRRSTKTSGGPATFDLRRSIFILKMVFKRPR